MTQPSFDGCKALYVGNLDARVTEEMLQQIFSAITPVNNVKIIRDRNYTHGGFNYGFVEFNDHQSADLALQSMSGRSVFGQEIRVNWASQGSTQKEDTSGHAHIFVGDLSPEVTDEVLARAFSPFRSMSEARVMWDQTTGKSRGYGFVAFRDRADAEQAIATMNGEWLGSRAIRCNWANQKNSGASALSTDASGAVGGTRANTFTTTAHLSYEEILAQTPPYHTTVYIGNLPHGISQQEIAPYFQQYGYVSDIRLQSDRGFAFVKMDTHGNAATAIFALQGFQIGGRAVKLSWGKDRNSANTNNPAAAYDPYTTYYASMGYSNQNWVQPTGYEMHSGMHPVSDHGHTGYGMTAEGWNQQYFQHQYQQRQ